MGLDKRYLIQETDRSRDSELDDPVDRNDFPETDRDSDLDDPYDSTMKMFDFWLNGQEDESGDIHRDDMEMFSASEPDVIEEEPMQDLDDSVIPPLMAPPLRQSVLSLDLELRIPTVQEILGPTDFWTNIDLNTGGRELRIEDHRSRQRLDPRQKETLDRIFRKLQNPPGAQLSAIAEHLGLPEKRVKTWFREHRKAWIDAGKDYHDNHIWNIHA